MKLLRGEWPVVAVDGEWYWDERSDDLLWMRHVGGLWSVILPPPPVAARAYPDAREVYLLTAAWD